MSKTLKAWKANRERKKLERLGKKGKLVSGQYLTKSSKKNEYNVESGDTHKKVKDPKKIVKSSRGHVEDRTYKVSKKGKIKKEM